MSYLNEVLSKLCNLAYTDRGLGASPMGKFCDFAKKIAIYNAIWITFRTILEPFEIIKLLKAEVICEN